MAVAGLSARKGACLTAANLGAQNAPAHPAALAFLPDGVPHRIGIKEG